MKKKAGIFVAILLITAIFTACQSQQERAEWHSGYGFYICELEVSSIIRQTLKLYYADVAPAEELVCRCP